MPVDVVKPAAARLGALQLMPLHQPHVGNAAGVILQRFDRRAHQRVKLLRDDALLHLHTDAAVGDRFHNDIPFGLHRLFGNRLVHFKAEAVGILGGQINECEIHLVRQRRGL